MIQFEDILKQKYSGIRFMLLQNDNKKTVYLTEFIVPIKMRSEGIGTSFMNDLTALADQYGYKITLTPSNSYGGSVSRLKDFYQRFGFVFNKGNNRDFSHREDMYRDPKGQEINEEGESTSSSSTGNTTGTGKKWETGLTRGHANPIANHGEWESGIKRGHANPVTTNEQIDRMKNLITY